MRVKGAFVLAGIAAIGLGVAACQPIGGGAPAGTPRFGDPAVQAKIDRFKADYARFGTDAGKLLGAPGESCRLTGPDAYRALTGVSPEVVQKAQNELNARHAGVESTTVVDGEAAVARVLTGTCGAQGPEGPAVIVGTVRSIVRHKGADMNLVVVSERNLRVETAWRDGRQVGPFAVIEVLRSATFEPDAAGKPTEKIYGVDMIDDQADAPIATYSYGELDAAGKPAPGTSVAVVRAPELALNSTIVTTQRDAIYSSSQHYEGDELIGESTSKNGKKHGWEISYPRRRLGMDLPGGRECFQNGEQIKALECPGI